MSEVFSVVFFAVWAGLILLGLRPELGVRFGVWLQNRADPGPPVPVPEPEAEHPNRLDRWA